MSAKRTWTCAECGLRTTFAAGAALSEPETRTWCEDADGWHCLRCRREEVVAHAGDDDAGEVAGKHGKSLPAQRRRALVEFELIRTPGKPDHIIAQRAACQTSWVAPVRTELVAAGRLPGGAPKSRS